MEKDSNHAGPFVRLKVVDAGGRHFSIFMPQGKGNEMGWRKTATLLREMGIQTRMEIQKRSASTREGGREKRLYPEVEKRWTRDAPLLKS